jgi:large subunit ribosomal protein L21
MYAIFQSGSKQYRVQKGDTVEVELLGATAGSTVELKEVLFVSKNDAQAVVGHPFISGCHIKAEVVAEVQGPKIHGVKYKRRKNNYRKFGHRQRYTQLRIVDIAL